VLKWRQKKTSISCCWNSGYTVQLAVNPVVQPTGLTTSCIV